MSRQVSAQRRHARTQSSIPSSSSQLRAQASHTSAHTAHRLVVRRAAQHEFGRRPANLGAGRHEPEIPGGDVLPAGFQATIHRHLEAEAMALKTFQFPVPRGGTGDPDTTTP
ncbi:MAG TPA: hypothetical protein VIL35_03860 [Vicinamibacterales bacterium]